ncbi:MAG TPA: hypothetical protein VGO57_15735 [Verrucomicrobiae bacterium]
MKTLLVLCLLAANVAWADPYSMAIQQAKRASDQNADSQRQIQQAAGAGSQSGGAASADPVMAAAMRNVAGLQTDITALNGDLADKPTTDQKISLLNNLSAAAQGAKATPDSVKTLAKDLTTALLGKKLTPAQQLKVARQIHAAFNGSHLTAAQAATIFDDLQKTLTGAGISLDATTDVITDLKKIADETK